MNKPITYKDSGVDISAGDDLVDLIQVSAKKTQRPEVLGGLGSFAGLFSLEKCSLKKPVLVASTDGVGTKLKLALDDQHIQNLGQDLVAMCVNDLICCGAEPLFFLDYYATGALNTAQAALVIQNIASCLENINCTLLGGETAEMPGLYAKGDFDLAGFAVGIVDRDRIITGEQVKEGDVIIGLTSSGVHSNGYSLVRKIIEQKKLDLHTKPAGWHAPLGQVLLEPTRIYVNPVLAFIKQYPVQAMAHITGGGLVENLPRVFPDTFQAQLFKNKIPTPAVFRYLQEQGNVPEPEMWRVFNMGIGFALIVDASLKAEAIKFFEQQNVPAFEIGVITRQ
ncbi:MAG TPA: phosphoribosylformylglycinamidine cyclo-ligase, partial [bacterium]|nr:phosphoribosylformylglycinamidine cyclo-ligase [bacterium]